MQDNKRSQQARINGAKSKGAVTPEGQQKAATASLKHGMYADENTLAWTIDQEKYDAHRQEVFDIWKPVNSYVARRLDVLVKVLWRLDCLTAFGWNYKSEMLHHNAANLDHMFQLTLEKGSLSDRIDAKIRQFNREIRALEREIDQLQRKFKTEGASHNPLKPKPSDNPWVTVTQEKPSISTGPCYQNSPTPEIPGNPAPNNADLSHPEPPDTALRS